MAAKPFEWAEMMIAALDMRSWFSIRSAWIHSIDQFSLRNCRLNLMNTNVTTNVWEWGQTEKVDCIITNPPTQPHSMPLRPIAPPCNHRFIRRLLISACPGIMWSYVNIAKANVEKCPVDIYRLGYQGSAICKRCECAGKVDEIDVETYRLWLQVLGKRVVKTTGKL